MEGYVPLLKKQILQYLGEDCQPTGSLKNLFDAINLTYQTQTLAEESLLPLSKNTLKGEERLHSLFEATFEGIVVHDQGIILDVNQIAPLLLGYSREEVLGVNAFVLIAEEFRQTVTEHMQTGYAEPYEIVLLRKDGTRLHVEICGRSHPFQGKLVRAVAFRDVALRKQYEEALHWQKTLLKRILDRLPIYIYLKDKAGHLVFINQYLCEKAGIKADQVIGKMDFELYDKEIASTFVADDQQVWQQDGLIIKEEKNEFEGVTRHMLTGKTIIHRSTLAPDNSEEPLLLSYSLDITERIRMEEELRATEHFIRQVLDTDPNPIYVRDYEGRFLMINQALADLASLTKEEFLLLFNDPACIGNPPEPYERFRQIERGIMENRQQVETEETYVQPGGEVRHFHAIKKPLLANDGHVHVLSILVDITEQKRTLERLQASEAQYRQIVEFANDMISQCDFRGNCTYVNPIGARVLGYTNTELIGKHFSEIVNAEHKEMVVKFYKEQFASRTLDSYLEFMADAKTGEQVWVGQTVHMLLDNNRITGFQGVARDITERKQVELELMRAKQVAEDSMRAKEQFLSVMSHELRTPLNAVIGITHLLIEKNAEIDFQTADLKGYLNAVKFSADSLMVIINDILDFSKIESGKVSFDQTNFELDSIFQGIRQSFGFEASEKNIRLLFNTAPALPRTLVGDQIRLQQIFTNLVGNALKFTGKGYIEISAEALAETDSTITLLFGVADTGIGIPAEKMQVIFESFTQASNDTAHQYGGTGLGLSISKQLVELQGGQIQVHSKLGIGSTFTFSLTFGKAAGESEARPTVAPKASLPNTSPLVNDIRFMKATVLLVEDNKMNQLVAGEFLRKWGLDIDIAANGNEALEKLQQNSYDLVLMDLQMPGMDGFTTARHIRTLAHLAHKDVPILAITASIVADVKNKALHAGMNDVLSKPFIPKELQNKLLRYLPVSHSQEVLPEKEFVHQFQYINLEYLESASINNVQFMEEMIRVFLRQTPDFINRARHTCQKQDWAELNAVVHKMKATTATVGISSLKPVFEKIASVLEPGSDLLKKQPTDAIASEMASLVETIAEVCQKAYHELEESLALLSR
ncbi:MAG: PAS domain S-box protein [Bacteroidota bacterium]